MLGADATGDQRIRPRLGGTQRVADQLLRAEPVEAHAALRRIHRFGNAEPEVPQIFAEGDGAVPVDAALEPGRGRSGPWPSASPAPCRAGRCPSPRRRRAPDPTNVRGRRWCGPSRSPFHSRDRYRRADRPRHGRPHRRRGSSPQWPGAPRAARCGWYRSQVLTTRAAVATAGRVPRPGCRAWRSARPSVLLGEITVWLLMQRGRRASQGSPIAAAQGSRKASTIVAMCSPQALSSASAARSRRKIVDNVQRLDR